MSKLTSLAALLAGMAAVGAAFPVTLELQNSVWRSLVEPESGKEVPGACEGVPGAAAFELRSEDQFVRILSNVEQINFINGFVDGEGLSIVFPGVAAASVEGDGKTADGQGADSGVGSQSTAESTEPPAPDPVPAPVAPEVPAAPAPAAPAAPSGNKQTRGASR